KARKVRIMSPKLMSRTSASATCTTTSTLRDRCRWRLSLVDRPPSRNPVPTCLPPYFSTGMEPNSRLATSDMARVKSTTGPSTPMPAHQDPQDLAHVAHHVLLQRAKVRPESRPFEHFQAEARWRRKTPLDDGKHPRHVHVGLVQRDARLQPRDGIIIVIPEG